MSSFAYKVNTNYAVDCSDIRNNLNGYGLVVGRFYNGGNNTVHGAIFLPEGTDTSSIQQLNDDCPIYTDKGTGLLDFDQTYTNAVYASKKFSSLPPTLLLTSKDTLHTLSNPAGDFQVITMNTCEYGCAFYEEQLSYPVNMLYGDGNWNGPQGMSWPKTLIVNIRFIRKIFFSKRKSLIYIIFIDSSDRWVNNNYCWKSAKFRHFAM